MADLAPYPFLKGIVQLMKSFAAERALFTCHLLFLGLDHLINHITDDRTVLRRG